jgi:hypothetical protein
MVSASCWTAVSETAGSGQTDRTSSPHPLRNAEQTAVRHVEAAAPSVLMTGPVSKTGTLNWNQEYAWEAGPSFSQFVLSPIEAAPSFAKGGVPRKSALGAVDPIYLDDFNTAVFLSSLAIMR